MRLFCNRFLFYTEIDISITPCMEQMALLTRLEFWANQLEIIISAYIKGGNTSKMCIMELHVKCLTIKAIPVIYLCLI